MTSPTLVLITQAFLLIGVILGAITIGAVHYPLTQIVSILVAALTGGESAPGSIIITGLRAPRILMAALTGASLAGAGACLQALFRNPLADPGLLGVTNGAAVGAAFAIVFGTSLFPVFMSDFSVYILPLCAFFGALLVTLALYGFSRIGGQVVIAYMLLTGIAINALAAVLIGLLIYISTDTQLRDFTFWSMGSLGAISWQTLSIAALPLVLAMAVMLRLIRPLNLIQLGEQGARHLGLNIEILKLSIVLLVALSVGTSVAFTGAIGFIGLVVPHLVRLLIGADHRYVIPGSLLLGAIVLVLSDLLARIIISPAELPIGLVTGAIGAPFFLWLLLRQQRLLRQ